MRFFVAFLLVSLFSTGVRAENSVIEEIARIELGAEVAEMVARDQAIRFGGVAAFKRGIRPEELEAHPLYQRKLGKIDAQNADRIKQIIEQHGWPKLSEHSEFTAHNVWLLVQHMDDDLPFQTGILKLMTDLLKKNEVLKTDYAYLYDRVQVNSGNPQLYGTQGRCEGKSWEPKPVDKPEGLEKRRKEMGFPPMEEYRKMFVSSCL